MKQKILITGAAGFMGSHLFNYLKTKGHNVWGVDNYSIGRYKDAKIIKCDVLNKKRLESIFRKVKPTVVFALHAWAHEGLSQFSPLKITENNYIGTLNVITSSIRNHVRRVIFTSSMSVYGDQKPPFNEKMPTKPVDIYGVSKEATERALEILCGVHGMEYVILRPHNVYGPGQIMHDPYRNVVAIFINQILKGKEIYIYGDGNQRRSFSYIDDITPYIAKAMDGRLNKQIINIGPTEEYTINQLVDCLEKAFGRSVKRKYLSDRPAEVKNAWCSNYKATKLLGYHTATPFQEGINKMVAWAKTVGPQRPVYLRDIELNGGKVPITWRKKLI